MRPIKDMYDALNGAGWPDLDIQEGEGVLAIPQGNILVTLDNGDLELTFFQRIGDPPEYEERAALSKVIFPGTINPSRCLYFKRNGNYSLNYEGVFRKVIDPRSRGFSTIRITASDQPYRRLTNNRLTISKKTFEESVADARLARNKSKQASSTFENYLTNIAAAKYSNDTRSITTSIEKGEFALNVNRLNLTTKKTKQDFLNRLSEDDISAIEALSEKLIRTGAFTDQFLSRLNDYFIKEKLKDIIELGRKILALGKTDLSTEAARNVLGELGIQNAGQLESVWQSYFEKYLLYLVFSYKRIFPKVELQNIDGDKKYPDFVGINHYNGVDVIEIKTHLKNAVVWDSSHENFYFSSELSKAIIQTTNYMDAIRSVKFQSDRDKRKVTEYTDEENLHYPRGIIIISSARKLSTRNLGSEQLNRDFTTLRNSVTNIQILTFDEILDIADQYLTNIVDEAE